MLLLCTLPLYCCDVKYAHTVQEMKFSSKLQAFEWLVEYVGLLISFEQKNYICFSYFAVRKYLLKLTMNIIEQCGNHTQTRDMYLTYV